jgi:ubiquinone/menaquinone biosynthesis C-methylase UbiE
MRTLIKRKLKRLLAQRGLAITGIRQSYMSAEETIAAADREGLSICDYVERLWEQQGCTQMVINQMSACSAFATTNPKIVEIGTGTGRYLEKVLQLCNPSKYESYEPLHDWVNYLQSKYSTTITYKADGETLWETSDNSANLVHAHGVFVYTPFLITYGYFKEIWRVIADSGIVAFDIFTEDCLDEETVNKWLSSMHRYPCFLSKSYVVSNFNRNGFQLLKTFKNKHGAGESEYLIFIRNSYIKQQS